MKVFYTTTNNGDGSAGVKFFETSESIQMLEDFDPETYGSGEGGSSFEVPDDIEIDGITIYNPVEVANAIEHSRESGTSYVIL